MKDNMNYLFKFKISHQDLFNSSINFMTKSKSFIFDILFTFLAIIITIYMFISNNFYNLEAYQKVLLFVACLIFPVIQPLIFFYKTKKRAKVISQYEICIKFNDNNIELSMKDEKSSINYENIYNLLNFKNMIVIMYDSIHGQIIPNRVFNNNKEEFYNELNEKIIQAKNNIKNAE